MSCNRDNVTWQSENGRWNIGFYEFWPVNQDDEDWDYEWDVDYGSDFHWVSTGHATQEVARDAWTGSNPGGTSICEFTPANAAQCAHYDQLARECKARKARPATTGSRW